MLSLVSSSGFAESATSAARGDHNTYLAAIRSHAGGVQTYLENVRHFSLGTVRSSIKGIRQQLENSKRVNAVAWVHD